MLVSNFELIFKPQAPSSPSGVPDVERVLQGYFLKITNLEEETFRYALDFVIGPPGPGTPGQSGRSLAGNTVVFIDVPDSNNQQGVLLGDIDDSVFRPSTGLVAVPPGATALVALLPSAFGPVPGDPTPLTTPSFEVRGFVRIRLPALRRTPPPLSILTQAQSDAPVKVLLTPQHRATFLTASGQISDQIQATLPLAAGQALNHVEPEPGGPIIILEDFEIDRLPFRLLERIQGLSDAQRRAILTALLSEVDPDRSDLKAYNAALGKAEVPLQLALRKR